MAIDGYYLSSHTSVNRGVTRSVIFIGELLYRYDYPTKAWVQDNSLITVFSGSPEVVKIDEAEARNTIERNGGTWAKPA